MLLFSSSSSVHVLQRELPSLCLCEGAAAFTICAADTVAGVLVCVRVCVCVCACVCLRTAIIFQNKDISQDLMS